MTWFEIARPVVREIAVVSTKIRVLTRFATIVVGECLYSTAVSSALLRQIAHVDAGSNLLCHRQRPIANELGSPRDSGRNCGLYGDGSTVAPVGSGSNCSQRRPVSLGESLVGRVR
jgi:hypothetical protein